MAIIYNPNSNAVQISGVAAGGPMAATITGCTAGNTLLCAITFSDSTATAGLPAPNAPPGWVLDSSSVVAGTIGILVAVYRRTAVAGSNTFSTAFVIGTSPFYWNGSLVEVTPLSLDKAPAPVLSSTTSLTGPNTGTLSSANEFVFAVCGNDISGTPVIPSLPTGFTSILADNGSNTNIGVRTAYQIVSATTAINPTWTVATAGTTRAAITTYTEGAPAIIVPEAVLSDHAGTARTSYTTNGFATAATVGSAIEVWIITSGTVAPTSVVDSASQTYTLQQSTTYFSGFNRFSVYVKTNNASATTLAITVTWPSNVTYAAIWQREIKGVSSIQGSAINTQTTPGTSANAITSGTITPSAQPAFLSAVTVNTEQGTPAAPEAGTGFTSGTIGFFNAGTRSESKSVTSLSAVAGTFTDTTGGGSANQYATGAILYSLQPPVITVQPTNQSALIGQTATFNVITSGGTGATPSTSLVGQQGTGWTLTNSLVQQTGGNAVYFASGYTATAGVATHVYFYAEGATTATVVKFAVYNAAGSLVGVTGSVNITGIGLVSAPFDTPVTLTAQVYKIVVVPASGYLYFAANSGSSGFSVNQNLAANFSYASPPSTLPAADSANNGQEFIVWLGTPVTYQWKTTLPPAYDNRTTYSLLVTGESSSSFSHTVGTASSRYLIVFLGRGTGFGTAPTSVTFGGVAMSLFATQQNASFGTETFAYGLIAPASGAGTVAVNWGVSTRGGIVAVSFSGVNQTTPYGTVVTSQTGTPTVVTSSIAGLVVDIFDTDTGDSYPLAAGSRQTVLANFLGSTPGGTATQGIGISTQKGASSVTMSWTGWHTANHIVVPLLSPVSPIPSATNFSYVTPTVGTSSIVATTGATTFTTPAVTTATSNSRFLIFTPAAVAAPTSVSDNKGNTYTLKTSLQFDQATTGAFMRVYECIGGVGGSGHTATAVWAASANRTVVFLEVRNSNATDVLVSAVDTSSPYTVTSPTLTSSAELAILMGSADGVGNPATYAESTGFTLLQKNEDNANYNSYFVASKNLTGSTAAITPSFTSTGSAAGASILMTFTPVSTSIYTTPTLASTDNGTLYLVDCMNSYGTTTSNTVRLLVSTNGVGRLGMFDPEMRILSWF